MEEGMWREDALLSGQTSGTHTWRSYLGKINNQKKTRRNFILEKPGGPYGNKSVQKSPLTRRETERKMAEMGVKNPRNEPKRFFAAVVL